MCPKRVWDPAACCAATLHLCICRHFIACTGIASSSAMHLSMLYTHCNSCTTCRPVCCNRRRRCGASRLKAPGNCLGFAARNVALTSLRVCSLLRTMLHGNTISGPSRTRPDFARCHKRRHLTYARVYWQHIVRQQWH